MANETVFRNGVVIKNGAQSGYILISDSNGLASWTASSVINANGVTGSGTANYVPRWISSTNISSTSSIYDSGTAVSIGYTASGATLDIKSLGSSALRVRNIVDTTNLLIINDDGGAAVGKNESTAPYLGLNPGGSTRATLRGNSSVSIELNNSGWNVLNGGSGGWDMEATSGEIRQRNGSNYTLLSGNYFGIGRTPTARLDVQAQGSQSTDVVFRVRNSGDSLDLISVLGNNQTIVGGDLLVMGSFSVLGSASVINTTNLSVSDPIILLAASQSGSPALDSGFFINRGTGATQAFIWDESSDEFAFIQTNDSASAIGNVNISSYANLRVNGLTSSQVRINATNTSSSFLTVRDSLDGYNILTVNGNGSAWINTTQTDNNLETLTLGGSEVSNSAGSLRIANGNGSLLIRGRLNTSYPSFISGNGNFAFETVDNGLFSYAQFNVSVAQAANSYITTLASNTNQSSGIRLSAGGSLGLFLGVVGTDLMNINTANGFVSIGYGSTLGSSAKLDIKAQGTQSSNLAFRVRNNGDTLNIIEVRGDETVYVVGTFSATGVIVSDGSVSNPKYSFANDTDTGLWRITSNVIGVAAEGATSAAFSAQGVGLIDGSLAKPSVTFIDDTDTGFYRSSVNAIGVAVGAATSSIFTTKGINLTDNGNNTVYGIATASNPSEAVRFSQFELATSYTPKSGYVEGASFSGSPLKYTVVFATQFPNDNTYSISIIGEDSRAWSVSNVTKTQFTIESNSSTTLTGRVRWMAQKYNDV
jgi:hypothetical protein